MVHPAHTQKRPPNKNVGFKSILYERIWTLWPFWRISGLSFQTTLRALGGCVSAKDCAWLIAPLGRG